MRVAFSLAGGWIVLACSAGFLFPSVFATTKSKDSGLQDSAPVPHAATRTIRTQGGAAGSGSSPDLLACADNGFRNVSFSLPIHEAAMATTGPAQANRNAGQAQCMQRLTITSTPCGATIYVDNIQAGQTPITFPMPQGRYTVVLVAPGHQPYAQRILVGNAPLAVTANLTPLP